MEEDELSRTILVPFSSPLREEGAGELSPYMLARDYMFLSQQQQQQPQYGYQAQVRMSSAAPVPSNSSRFVAFFWSAVHQLQSSELSALTPIPIPGSIDSLSGRLR
jgi:hypothetical protein